MKNTHYTTFQKMYMALYGIINKYGKEDDQENSAFLFFSLPLCILALDLYLTIQLLILDRPLTSKTAQYFMFLVMSAAAAFLYKHTYYKIKGEEIKEYLKTADDKKKKESVFLVVSLYISTTIISILVGKWSRSLLHIE